MLSATRPSRIGLNRERHPRGVRSFVLNGGKMARPADEDGHYSFAVAL
jgi:hypothetical protein